VLVSVAGVALIAFGIRVLLRALQPDPEKRERKRRLDVFQFGRLGDALITDASDTLIFYSYSLGGVQYDASQDISAIRYRVPNELARLVGDMAQIKYAWRNPANSILICEEWSGLRSPKREVGAA